MDEGASEPVDFFVSYAAADGAWAEWIAWELEEGGFHTVLQAWDFRPGDDFVGGIGQSLDRARRLLAVLSPAYVSSRWAKIEWNAAFAADPGRCVSVRVVDFDPPNLYASQTYVDLVGADEGDAGRTLLAGMEQGRVKPPVRPPFPPSGAASRPTAGAPPPFPGRLPQAWNVPHHRNPNFVGREDLLQTLGVAPDGGPRLPTQALVGLGGVGKTQLAVELAYRVRDRFDVVWWMRAEHPLTLKADLAALGSALGHGNDEGDLDTRAAIARRWLEHHDRWLVVLDNADDPEAIRPVLPQGGGGRVLITSRGGDWRSVADVVKVPVLAPEEALAFLTRRTGRSEPEAARALADELGLLPLALEQAGAVVAQSPTLSIGDYHRQYGRRASELWRRGADTDMVATTWDLAFQRAGDASAAARDLLHLMAFLGPDDIPPSILGAVEVGSGPLAAVADDPLAVADAFAALARYSLVEATGDGDGATVHRLVQAVVRDQLGDDGRARWAAIALGLVARQFPDDFDDPRTWKATARLLPHVQAVTSHVEQLGGGPDDPSDAPSETGSGLVSLLNRAARFLLKSGQRLDAVVLAENTAERAASLLHPEHVERLRAEAVMAVAYQQAGRTDEAVDIGRRVLADRERILGDDHLDTVSSRADLAVSYQWARSSDCLKEAVELGERSLEQRERLLGPSHPETLWSRAELSWAYWWVGRVDEAIALREQVRDERRPTVDDDHPTALWDEANVAIGYQMVGRVAEALVTFERVFETRNRRLGPDHPDTLFTMARLGLAYQAVGRPEDAIRLGERAVDDSRRILGDDHPDTLSARSLLAASYRSVDRVDEAVAIGEQVLADRRRLLAPDHLDILWAQDDLAYSYQRAGRTAEAVSMTDHVLRERERILGPDHPDTLATRRRRDELGVVVP